MGRDGACFASASMAIECLDANQILGLLTGLGWANPRKGRELSRAAFVIRSTNALDSVSIDPPTIRVRMSI